MHSFLPIPQCEQQEIQAIQQKLSSTHFTQAMSWPTVDSEPINEYTTPFLATMSSQHYFLMAKVIPQTRLFTETYNLEKKLNIF